MKNWVGIEGGQVRRNVHCVGMSVIMSHVLWECSAYRGNRTSFMKKLQELLEDDYEDFESLEYVEKSSYVPGNELWESKFDGLLAWLRNIL